MTQRLFEHRLQAKQFLNSRRRRTRQRDRDGINSGLLELILPQVRKDLQHPLGLQHWPEVLTCGAHGHIASSAHNPAQGGQAPAARTRRPHLGPVAQRIADQGHREVVQIGHHHLTDLAFPAGLPLFIEHFHQQVFGLHMQQAALWALQGDDTDLLRAVEIGQGHAQGVLAPRSRRAAVTVPLTVRTSRRRGRVTPSWRMCVSKASRLAG